MRRVELTERETGLLLGCLDLVRRYQGDLDAAMRAFESRGAHTKEGNRIQWPVMDSEQYSRVFCGVRVGVQSLDDLKERIEESRIA